jgi:hypothetical protein
MTLHMKRPPAGGADGPLLELSSLGGVDCSESGPNSALNQAEISRSPRAVTGMPRAVSGSVVSFSARHCRRSPAPPRYDVRVTMSSACSPIGRSRAFRLSENAIEGLIDFALRLEARRA